ncbi:MAG: magnesium transporter [Gammaproteobacteria bacterium]|nr:magnesium transporter [Gammaproteobacteria bacterium]
MSDRQPQRGDELADINDAIDRGALLAIRKTLRALHPAEVAHTLESLPRNQRQVVWQLISDEDEGDVLLSLNEEARTNIVRSMSAEELQMVVSEMEVDDLADFIGELPAKLTEQVLRSMSHQDRERLKAVLIYDEDTAGGLMNTDTITVRPDVPVDVILRYLRAREQLPPGTDQLFVVNRYGRYLGAVPLSVLVTEDDERLISEIMDTDARALHAEVDSVEVANFFTDRDLVSAAVVDGAGQLLGRITVDDVIDVIREQAEKSFMSMAGLDEDIDMFAPVWVSSGRRAIWLGVNLLTAFIAARVVGLFEATIEQIVALAVLMPVVASMGGIAGTQTLTLITRGLALGQINRSNTWWLTGKEFLVGAVNGILWATVVAAITFAWFGSIQISGVIALAMVINLMVAGLSGVVIPILLKRFNIDPALAGGVVLTTITDVVGYMAFLGLGSLILLA